MSVSIERVPTADVAIESCWAEVLQAFGLRRDQDHPEEPVRVLVQPQDGRHIQGEASLPDFEHPEHARYIFGPDDGHLEAEAYDVSVYVPQKALSCTLFSHQAAAIVLYDRMVKRGD